MEPTLLTWTEHLRDFLNLMHPQASIVCINIFLWTWQVDKVDWHRLVLHFFKMKSGHGLCLSLFWFQKGLVKERSFFLSFKRIYLCLRSGRRHYVSVLSVRPIPGKANLLKFATNITGSQGLNHLIWVDKGQGHGGSGNVFKFVQTFTWTQRWTD